ncbi:putative NADH-ubiquinone oxidoreductase chain 2, partial [Listeria ivanovii FSL F6-596]
MLSTPFAKWLVSSLDDVIVLYFLVILWLNLFFWSEGLASKRLTLRAAVLLNSDENHWLLPLASQSVNGLTVPAFLVRSACYLPLTSLVRFVFFGSDLYLFLRRLLPFSLVGVVALVCCESHPFSVPPAD